MADESLLSTAPSATPADAGAAPADAGAGAKPADGAAPATQGQQPPADPNAKPAETEAKADGEKKEGEGDKKPDDAKPIEYGEFKLPDGVKVDEAALTSFKAISQEARVPPEVAQKYVDLYAEKVKEIGEAPYKEWAKTQEGWVKDVKADPEIGGDKLQGALADAGRALDMFGGPKLREALTFTGAGNHPEMLRAFARIGKAIGPDNHIAAGGSAPARSAADVLYPSMNKE